MIVSNYYHFKTNNIKDELQMFINQFSTPKYYFVKAIGRYKNHKILAEKKFCEVQLKSFFGINTDNSKNENVYRM